MKKELLFLSSLFVLAMSCTKTVEDNTKNPFGNSDVVENPIDSTNPQGIIGLHKNIFAAKCANPTCHDGTFEPDFRTIESTYQTLVYHDVTKNDSLNSFEFRVLPGNADKSWLIERLITQDPILGRMPLYAPKLSDTDLNNLKAWINAGAPDSRGTVPKFPNLNPVVNYFIAYDNNQNRLDTNRVDGWASAMIIPNGTNFKLVCAVSDDSTASQDLMVNKFHLSTDIDDFTNAQVYNATYYTSKLWTADIPSSAITTNTTMYFRYEVKDPDHNTTVFHPNQNSPSYIKKNASFIVQ